MSSAVITVSTSLPTTPLKSLHHSSFKSKSTTKIAPPSMPEFEGAMRRVRQHIMARPTPEVWPSERVGDPRCVPKPYTMAMQFMGKKSDKVKRRRADNGEMAEHTARSANCFILFRMHVHQIAIDLFPAETKALQDKLSARAGELWKELSKEAKEAFSREAKQMERFHKVQFPDYKYRPAKNKRLAALSSTAAALKKSVDGHGPTANNNSSHTNHNLVKGRRGALSAAETELLVAATEQKMDCLSVTIPNFSSSFSDSFCSPYSSPGAYSCSPGGGAPTNTAPLSPFSAWQATHLPQLLEAGASDDDDEFTYHQHVSPFHSSLPPATPGHLRLQSLATGAQLPRPCSQPNEIMMRVSHQKLQQQQLHNKAPPQPSLACRRINFYEEDTGFASEMDMTLATDLTDGVAAASAAELLSPTPCTSTADPFISSGALLDEDVISVEASSLEQLPAYASSTVRVQLQSSGSVDQFTCPSANAANVDSVDVSWLQALQCVGQGFGGACLAVSGGWMDAPLPADLMDIPLRTLEQSVTD